MCQEKNAIANWKNIFSDHQHESQDQVTSVYLTATSPSAVS